MNFSGRRPPGTVLLNVIADPDAPSPPEAEAEAAIDGPLLDCWSSIDFGICLNLECRLVLDI